jgi:hypothetical protein
MTVTIDLPPEIEADLVAHAQAQGLPVPEYLQFLLREHVPAPAAANTSPTERPALWRESVKDLPQTPPLSDEAISRETIYGNLG